jgi:hypothetical protein
LLVSAFGQQGSSAASNVESEPQCGLQSSQFTFRSNLKSGFSQKYPNDSFFEMLFAVGPSRSRNKTLHVKKSKTLLMDWGVEECLDPDLI